MVDVRSKMLKRCCKTVSALAIAGAMLIPVCAEDDVTLWGERAARGQYGATIEEMTIRRLYSYGILNELLSEQAQDGFVVAEDETIEPEENACESAVTSFAGVTAIDDGLEHTDDPSKTSSGRTKETDDDNEVKVIALDFDVPALTGKFDVSEEEMLELKECSNGFVWERRDMTDKSEDTESDLAEANSADPASLPVRLEGIPGRLDAALAFYKACGEKVDAQCEFVDVPESYQEAVAWLCESGTTKGIGDGMYGDGDITREQFFVMLSRLLRWNTEDIDNIKERAVKYKLAPAIADDEEFSYGEMYQIICKLLDHAYLDRCVPENGKSLTPYSLAVCADSCEDAFKQIKEAARYLPKIISVSFSDVCSEEDIALFVENLDWSKGQKTMPLLGIANPRWDRPFSMRQTGHRSFDIRIRSYSQASEATANTANWREVFEDDQYADALRDFYTNNIFRWKKLPEYNYLIQCHDAICRLASYDDREFNSKTGEYVGGREKAHDIVGFMEDNQIVCDGYANLLSWLMMEKGIDSYVVIGATAESGHAWNKLFLSDDWYNVDVCSNDLDIWRVRPFFLKSDSMFEENGYIFTDSFSTTTYKSVG